MVDDPNFEVNRQTYRLATRPASVIAVATLIAGVIGLGSAVATEKLKAENIVPHGVNPMFFPLTPNHKHIHERPDHPDGRFRKETIVLSETEEFSLPDIGTFKTAIVQEEDIVDGALTKRRRSWLALDNSTNAVYAFGEINWDIEDDGKQVLAEIWRAGDPDRSGKIAEPSLVMPGSLFASGRDTSQKIETGIEIDVPAGKFKDCIRFRERDLAISRGSSDKIWCPVVGVAFDPEDGKLQASSALPKDNPASDVSSIGKPREKPAKQALPIAKITEDVAKAIALKHLPGKITDVKIERKLGKHVYVVEIQTRNGEKDVFVDIENGRVVGVD